MKTDLRHHIAEIARHILGTENKERSTRAQLRFGNHGSISLEIAGADCGKWYDHENAIGGGPVELIHHKGGIPANEVAEWLRRELGIDVDRAESRRAGRIVATYDYRDETGALLFQVVR